MTRHAMLISAAFMVSLAVGLAVGPARTAPEPASFRSAPQSMQSSGVHALVAGSFHGVSVGF